MKLFANEEWFGTTEVAFQVPRLRRNKLSTHCTAGCMPSVDEFRASLAGAEPEDLVERWMLVHDAEHLTAADIAYIGAAVSAAYGVSADRVQIWITGSAKLGFSTSEKHREDKPPLPRYRLFGPASDIDVAVVAPDIFDLIWTDISKHSHGSVYFPLKSNKLGDYLVCGWLRPDHFPKNVRLRFCDAWFDLFNRLSINSRFKKRAVKGGLFYSRDQLVRYLSRSVRECIELEAV